ncbi:hypothetical protein Tco_1491747 [Tanacetum coccineum]
MLLCCEPNTAYGLHPIWRISDESALVVEIDFTWSLRFGYVEPGRPPTPLSSRISLMMFEFSSSLFADSAMNLVSDSSNVDMVFQTMCNMPLREYSLLPLVGSPLCSVVLCIVRIQPEHSCSRNVTFRVKDLSGGSIEPIIE